MLNTVIAILLPAFDLGVESFFNIGWGGKASGANFNTGGGGVYCKNVYTRMHAHMHMCAYIHTHVHAAKCSYTMHTCTHTHVCMHAHAYARIHLHPDMKIIKIKGSDLYEKKNKYIHVVLLQLSEVNEESFWLSYCLKAI